ncbi:MAG: aldo/keto reductase [Bryobacteraceae bacterium]|jgi:aryl-alcohol dehydrogenase-like predicted oxidoreductase
MQLSFERATLGRTGREVGRLGMAAGYGVPTGAVERAFEQGVNYLYWGSVRTKPFAQALRNLAGQRDRMMLVIQSYSRMAALVGGSLERALRAVGYDHADLLLLGMWQKPVPPRILDAAREAQRRGLVRRLAVSTHKRTLVPEIARGSDFDVVHFRYNAVHVGAERDIFPHLPAGDRPGLVSFTATSWGQLTSSERGVSNWRQWFAGGRIPKGERTPTAADCYRFVLAQPDVDVCLTGPSTAEHVDEGLAALRRGPMTADELDWMRRVGRAVYGK